MKKLKKLNKLSKWLTAAVILGMLVLNGCQPTETQSQGSRTITVLYTNDEHGWMEGKAADQGAANLLGLWQEQLGYTEDGPFLVLSGGDNFTGPAISTWVEGESMVDVMNNMGYDASAVGNHEFDFGVDVLWDRAQEADYPYLSANTRWRESGEVPIDIGILPFTVTELNDLRIGIVGLTARNTPTTTIPTNVIDLEFIDYEAALRQTVPRVREENIDLLLVVSHVCMAELMPLATTVVDLNIQMIGGGHCNELVAQEIAGIVLLEGGFHFTAYAHASFTFNLDTSTLTDSDYGTNDNLGGTADETITGIVQKWADRSESSLSEVLGYSANNYASRSDELLQAIIDSWLITDPTADFAITNAGGIRADLPQGDITLGTLVSILPFENTIVAANVKGAAIIDALKSGRTPIYAGIEKRGQDWLTKTSSEKIDNETTYRVLINSFMYAGGDNYSAFAEADGSAFDTAIHYRQPFLDWIVSTQSNEENPLQL